MQCRTLANGVQLPMIGYGTFQIQDAALCEQCVSDALEAAVKLAEPCACGIFNIDKAEALLNELAAKL